MIALQHLHTYNGPNIYAAKPVILATLTIDDALLATAPEKIDRICQQFPNWFAWAPKAKPIGKAEIADFLVAFACAALSEVRGSVPLVRLIPQEEKFLIVLSFHDAGFSFHGLQLAASIFLNVQTVDEERLLQRMYEFWQVCAKLHPDFQAQFLIDHCEAHGLPYRCYMPTSNIWQYGSGNRSITYNESSPSNDNYNWSRNKVLCKNIFRTLGAPVAHSALVKYESELAEAVAQVGFPCVVKPTDQARGDGVLSNLIDLDAVKAAFENARKFSRGIIMIERYIPGEIHRLFVIRGKLWKTIRRARPHIIGDGSSSIKTLLEEANAQTIKKMRPEGSRGPVPLDDDFIYTLLAQGLMPASIPAKGQRVIVRGVATAEQGSNYLDVTDKVHPDTKRMCETLAQCFSISVCGLDFITEDISRSCFEMGGFIEINTTPGLRTPMRAGTDRAEIARMVLGDAPGRIPVLLVIAAREHHDGVRQMIPMDDSIGWVCAERSGIATMEYPDKQATYLLTQRLLKNVTIAAIIVVCTPEELVAQGMPLDKVQTVVLYADAALDEAWKAVLTGQCEELVTLKDAAELAALMQDK